MAEKRSLSDALTLTPKERAFIQGDNPQAATPVSPPQPRRGRRPKVKTVEVELSKDSPQADAPRLSRPRERPPVRSEFPNANAVLDEVLLPLTTRLPHRLIQSLRRVCLERRLQHQKPDSIQEVVEEAIGEWLSRQA